MMKGVTMKFYQFPGTYGLSSASPFCTKLETFLRMVELPYETRNADPRKAPRGKTPYLAVDGELIGDTQLLIELLKRKHDLDIDAHLSAEDHTRGHLVRRMCEEHTYWAIVYSRWIDERGWAHQRRFLKTMLPTPLNMLLPRVLRRGVRKSLHAQGLGRHDEETLYTFCLQDIEAAASALGDSAYLLGERWSSYDASFFATLWHLHQTPTDNPATLATKAQPNLVAYIQRMKERLGFE